MILRTWKARTSAEKEDAYLEQVRTVALPYLKKYSGYRGSQFYKRRIGGGALEILVLTCWDSYNAVDEFSGGETRVKWIPPEIAERLESWDDNAEHFELILDDSGSV